jgi:pyruvate,orthophosphate dikinase
MDGLPVTIRLLDPPLHEFLPDLTELSVKVASTTSATDEPNTDSRLLSVQRLHEQNPMLGLRGRPARHRIPACSDAGRAILEAAATGSCAAATRAGDHDPAGGAVRSSTCHAEIDRGRADGQEERGKSRSPSAR